MVIDRCLQVLGMSLLVFAACAGDGIAKEVGGELNADVIVAEDDDGIEISVSMVREELSFRSPEEQSLARHDLGVVEGVVRTLFRRQKLLRKAEEDNVEKDPRVRYKLEMARKDVLINALKEKVAEQPIPNMELRAEEYYRVHQEEFFIAERRRASHILLKAVTENERVQRKEEMQKILQELSAGAGFSDLAQKYSEDSSREKGGDLGWFSKDQIEGAVAVAVFGLSEPGVVSGIIESQYGVHLVRLTGRESELIRPFEEVKAELVKKLSRKYQKDLVSTWLNAVTSPNNLRVNYEVLSTLAPDAPKMPVPIANPATMQEIVK